MFVGRTLRERRPRYPEGCVGYAIGDIHGRLDLLKRLATRIQEDAAGAQGRQVIFLGDYIDRGPDPAGVVSFLLDDAEAFAGFERRYLLGNHEASLLAFLKAPAKNFQWLRFGGLNTLASYGVSPLPTISSRGARLNKVAEKFRTVLPAPHLKFFDSLERYTQSGDYVFVHAGVTPRRPLTKQTDADLLWIRDRFLNAREPYAEGMVVHGHTPETKPFRDHRRIGVDTGAYFSGRLTAVRLEGEDVRFLTVTDK